MNSYPSWIQRIPEMIETLALAQADQWRALRCAWTPKTGALVPRPRRYWLHWLRLNAPMTLLHTFPDESREVNPADGLPA